MRIVSLLPSLTELVVALGRGADLVGVTHECDYPEWVRRLPHLTRSRIPSDLASAEIDTLVAQQGGSLYELDERLLAELRPDLILTQAQCDVCAVNETRVRDAALALPDPPPVESVNPTTLQGVHAMFRRVGDLLDATDAADRIIRDFEATAATIADRRQGRPTVDVLHLEWLDPPFTSGHWNPELIALAGGREVVAKAGEPSGRWDGSGADRVEVVLVAPCGFTLEQTRREWDATADRPWRRSLESRSPRIVLADGSAYFSRPGPRLEMSLRIAAAAIDPATCGDLAPVRECWTVRSIVPTERPG